MTTNDKKSETSFASSCSAPWILLRLKFHDETMAERVDRSMHSLDQLSSFQRDALVDRKYLRAEHAALIFIACKLLCRPRCISVVFATIGPISAVSDPSLPSSRSILFETTRIYERSRIERNARGKSSQRTDEFWGLRVSAADRRFWKATSRWSSAKE